MTDKTNQVERLEWIVEQLADSVLELSDEAILAEIKESGADPQEEAERVRFLLRQVSKPAEVANGNQRLTSQHLGRAGALMDGRKHRDAAY
jgi:hypothetical protein